MKQILPITTLVAASLLTACQTTPTTTSKVAPIYGPSNPTKEQAAKARVKYYGAAIELKPEKEKQYRELHANVWPEVKTAIRKANIRNYNIYLGEIRGKKYLFSQFEYIGTNPDKDFGSIAKDPTTKNKWWPITDACQQIIQGTPKGKQWMDLEQLMHLD